TRRLQASGDLARAEAEVRRGLELYPSDARLTAILDALQSELTQSNRKKARIEQLREEQQKSGIRHDSEARQPLPPTMVVVRGMGAAARDAPTVIDEPALQGPGGGDTMIVPRPVLPTTPPVAPAPLTPASTSPAPTTTKGARPAAVRKTTPMTAQMKSRL